MPVTIDELIVSLGFDPKGLTEGEKVAMATLGRTKSALKQSAQQAEAEQKRSRDAIAQTAKTRAKGENQDATASRAQAYRMRQKRNQDIEQAKLQEKFEKTGRDDSRKSSREREIQLKSTAQLFDNARNRALAFLAVAVGAGGVGAFVANSVPKNAALGRSAANIGTTVPELSAIGNLVERNGGDAGATQAALQGLTDQMELLKVTGNSAILPYMQLLHGVSRSSGALDIIKSFVTFADQHKNDRPLVNLIGKGLGLDQGLINEALKGSAQFYKDLAEAQKAAANPEQTRRAAELQSAWKGFGQQLGKIGDKVLYDLEPALTGLLNWMTSFAEKHPRVVAGFTAIAGAIGTGLGTVVLLGKLRAVLAMLGVVKAAAVETAVAETAAAGGSATAAEAAAFTVGDLAAPAAGVAVAAGAAGAFAVTAPMRAERELRRQHPSGDLGAHDLDGLGPTSDQATSAGGSAGAVAGHIAALIQMGVPRSVAIGIGANIQAESGGNPKAFNPAGGGQGAFGLIQFRGARLDALKAFARANGLDYRTSEAQLPFIVQELKTTESKAGGLLSGQNSPGLNAAIFDQYDERSGGGSTASRVAFANRLAQLLGPGPSPDGKLASGATSLAGGGNSSSSTSTHSTDVRINNLTVETQATDAHGIAKTIVPALKGNITTQANQGLF